MTLSILLPIVLLAANALAQTFTTCNPLNATCPSDVALGTTFSTNFTSAMSEFDPRFWNVTAGTSLITFGDSGANLPLTKATDTVTVQSNFYIMWGQVEFIMKAAPGQGIISTAILISDDLDEIDWEIMGGNSSYVENNWYGWGNLSQFNAKYEPLQGAMDGFHNYTIDWNQQQVNYMIDGNIVRTVPYDAPGQYPQTPMQVRFGIWPAGASNAPGTVEWAGGKTDFSKGPFAMQIKSIRVTDGTSNVSSYSYGDHSGSFESIKSAQGESQAYTDIHTLSKTQQYQAKWNNLSQGAKIGIACGVLGGFAIFLIIFAFYCIGQRRQGRKEREIADQEWNKHTKELMDYRQLMARGQFAVQHMGHGQEKF